MCDVKKNKWGSPFFYMLLAFNLQYTFEKLYREQGIKQTSFTLSLVDFRLLVVQYGWKGDLLPTQNLSSLT